MKSGRGGSRPAEKVVAAVAAKGEWDTSRPRVAYSSGKHKEEGNNSRESSTRKNIYGSVIPPCSKFFFFLGNQLYRFFSFTPSFSLTNIFSFTFYFSLSLSLPIVRSILSIRFPVLQSGEFVQPIPKLTVLRSTKLDDRRKMVSSRERKRSRERFGSSPWLVIPARLGCDIER